MQVKQIEEKKENYKFLHILREDFRKRSLIPVEDIKNFDKNLEYEISLTNKNDITFQHLSAEMYSINITQSLPKTEYFLNLYVEDVCDGGCSSIRNDWKMDDYENKKSESHCHNIQTRNSNLDDYYRELMKKMHELYSCTKCKRKFRRSDDHAARLKDEDRAICNTCLISEDAYVSQPRGVKRKQLFDCYVCGQENIVKKLKADLKCSGSAKHEDKICVHCYDSFGGKCPMCRQ